MEMVVDHPGNDGMAPEVNRIRTAAGSTGGVAHFNELSVGHEHFRHDRAPGIHRVNFPVGQQQQTAAGTILRLSRSCAQQKHDCECR